MNGNSSDNSSVYYGQTDGSSRETNYQPENNRIKKGRGCLSYFLGFKREFKYLLGSSSSKGLFTTIATNLAILLVNLPLSITVQTKLLASVCHTIPF